MLLPLRRRNFFNRVCSSARFTSIPEFLHTLHRRMANPVVGIIGGSGFYSLDLTIEKEIDVTKEVEGWPFGTPSSPVTIARLKNNNNSKGDDDVVVAFIARHGKHHAISPSHVPNAANIAALKHVGVQAIVAFSAVGSLREEIKPRDVVIPSQIIDRTKGIRPSTYFENGIVAHAMLGDPFDNQLIQLITPLIKSSLAENNITDVDTHSNKTVVCMEGPQFSTRAESLMYRQWGADIINMSVLPEAKFAREAELSYAVVATATDYDAWRSSEEPVTVAEVMATLSANSRVSKIITQSIVAQLSKQISQGALTLAKGSMQYSIVTKAEHQPSDLRKKLSYVLPYFKD